MRESCLFILLMPWWQRSSGTGTECFRHMDSWLVGCTVPSVPGDVPGKHRWDWKGAVSVPCQPAGVWDPYYLCLHWRSCADSRYPECSCSCSSLPTCLCRQGAHPPAGPGAGYTAVSSFPSKLGSAFLYFLGKTLDYCLGSPHFFQLKPNGFFKY